MARVARISYLGADKLLTDRTAANLVLQPYVLEPATHTASSLRRRLVSDNQGYSQVSIEVNEPPSVGTVSVQPATGTALVTTFEVRASNFFDEDQPLACRFGYGSHDLDTGRYLTDFQPVSQVKSLLPPGDAASRSRQYNYPVFIEVQDMYGSRSQAMGSVSVSPLDSGAGDIETIATTDLLSAASAEGDVQKSAQLVQSIADTLNVAAGRRRRLQVNETAGHRRLQTVTPTATANCVLTGTADFGVTPGSCAVSGTATCAYVAGAYSDSDSDGTSDTEDTSDSCTSTTVAQDFTDTRRLLVETLETLSATQTLTQDIAERMTQALASVTAKSSELDVTSVTKTMAICEQLSIGAYAMNDATAASLLLSVRNSIAASELLYADDGTTRGHPGAEAAHL